MQKEQAMSFKRILILFLAVVMIFAISGCKEKTNQEDKTTPGTTQGGADEPDTTQGDETALDTASQEITLLEKVTVKFPQDAFITAQFVEGNPDPKNQFAANIDLEDDVLVVQVLNYQRDSDILLANDFAGLVAVYESIATKFTEVKVSGKDGFIAETEGGIGLYAKVDDDHVLVIAVNGEGAEEQFESAPVKAIIDSVSIK